MTSIEGFGGYVPQRVMTNDDWAQILDTTAEEIHARTGIRQRRIASEDESTLDLALSAAEQAMDDAGVVADQIDEIIVATDSPEVYLPDTASFLQYRLGCRHIPTYDVGGSGSAGWLQGLDIARARVQFEPKKILVIGVDVISRLGSWEDRDTSALFGDAAGAVVLGPGKGKADVLDVITGTDGSKADLFTRQTGGTLKPFTTESAEVGAHQHLEMDESELLEEALRRMSSVTFELLGRIGRDISDVSLVIPHQASKMNIDALRLELGVVEDSMYTNIQDYGNTGAASLPFGLFDARQRQLINTGDLVILAAFGGGFHWAAAAIEF